jgi:PHD/YefM family antitoxin component YafN of YafNO toxin-antitoxin module
MNAVGILETAQYVVDKRGRQTAVLLDLTAWRALQELLEELAEDERLGELMTAVQNDEKFIGEAAQEVYKAYLLEANQT